RRGAALRSRPAFDEAVANALELHGGPKVRVEVLEQESLFSVAEVTGSRTTRTSERSEARSVI
ncbi:MAG: hypothetical protein AAGE52_28825, partial [Myxococcota bacterium]